MCAQYWEQCGGGGGGREKIQGPGGPEGGPVSDYVAYFLSFSVVLLITDCTDEPFQTWPKLLYNWQSVFPI